MARLKESIQGILTQDFIVQIFYFDEFFLYFY